MDYTHLLDDLPLWLIFLLTVAIVIGSIEAGYRLGRSRRVQRDSAAEQEKEAPVGTIVAATLGLLAFMLGFTFSLSASRFDSRRMVVLEESNAVGTAWLRAGLLPAPQGKTIQRLLGEYVAARLEAVQANRPQAGIAKSEALHTALWAQAKEVADQDSHSIITGLFIQSLNEVIDLHSKRVLLSLHNRIPEMVWLVLYSIAILSMAALGYQEGLSGSRRSLAVGALAVTFTVVILLIVDLDQPNKGLLRVSQGTLLELQKSISAPP